MRQFRPAVRRFTLEFPGGMRDGDEAPETCAIRELAEEVGLAAPRLQTLAALLPNSGGSETACGRISRATRRRVPDWRPETGVERMMVSIAELHALALDGSLDHAPHVAMLGMAVIRGWLPPP